jgi:hypothetical protein
MQIKIKAEQIIRQKQKLKKDMYKINNQNVVQIKEPIKCRSRSETMTWPSPRRGFHLENPCTSPRP